MAARREFVSEFLGTAFLHLVAPAVGCFIGGAYWFTSSTSFANPAVTLARSATDTFAGIRPADVPAFIVAQSLAAVAVVGGSRLFRSSNP